MKLFFYLLINILPIMLWAQPNYDSLSKKLVELNGFSDIVTKEIDTVKLIEKLLENYGNDNCLNSTWAGYANYIDTYNRNVRSSSIRASSFKLTINRISALYLVSSLFYADTLFTKSIALKTMKRGKERYITGVEVLFPKERPDNSVVLFPNGCDRYGIYKVKLQDVKLINKAVDLYKRWFILLKIHGMSYLRENNIFPLSESEIYWEAKK
jgi:hypothetical protein